MNGATSVSREFELYNGKSSLKITDRIKCIADSEIYWFMHTKADIEIAADGKSAVLTIGEKQMKASLLADGRFTVMPASALSGSYEYDADYQDISKLTVELDDVKSAQITVTLEPVK